MSGHSHWKQIKIQKGTTDQKRAQVFSKLLAAITVAARGEPNPQFNARLRTAILKARESQVPQDNIERAITKAADAAEQMEELVVEAYGPGGIAMIIEAITQSSNRTINELKQIFKEHETKLAEPGSVRWAFEKSADSQGWRPKFFQDMDAMTKEKLGALIQNLNDQSDVQEIYTNAKP